MPTPQGRYWMLTIPVIHMPNMIALIDPICYLKGQQETGGSGLVHWQMVAVTNKKVTRRQLKELFVPEAHLELSRSEAANEYVWKDDTAIADTRFELGRLPISRARPADWDKVYDMAKVGNFEELPKDILIRHYSSLKRIYVDNVIPVFRPDIKIHVFHGTTGTGKSRRAWQEAMADGEMPFIKNPNTKWWDGYRGQKNVIIDEFTGRIDISYLLLWTDEYPAITEVKGFATPLNARNFWITSNLAPREWYVDAKPVQLDALIRRFHVCDQMMETYVPPVVDELENIFEL